jgi:hypothetical protein
MLLVSCQKTDRVYGLPSPIPWNHVILDYANCLLIVSDYLDCQIRTIVVFS